MKEYFSHDYHARHDFKLANLLLEKGLEAVGAYWCIIEMLYENDGNLPMQYERIANALRGKNDVIRAVVEDFDLFKNDGQIFWSNSVLMRLQERQLKSDTARASVNKRWHKDTNVLPTQIECNTIKESKVKESKEKNNICRLDFGSVWNKYPNKDGRKLAERAFKSSVRTEKDYTDIQTALANYLKSDNVAKGFIKNGSTWFNNWRDWIVPPKTGVYDDRPDYLRPKST